jgi:hypothetical protein
MIPLAMIRQALNDLQELTGETDWTILMNPVFNTVLEFGSLAGVVIRSMHLLGCPVEVTDLILPNAFCIVNTTRWAAETRRREQAW